MMLVEEGKVRLDDTITKYFPEAPQAWSRITIRQLLTHTSGIQNHVAVPHWLDVFRTNLAFETTPPRDELLKMFFKLPLEFQPGETWEYDNTGYYLLGIIIEKVSGKSYWQFLDERIFKPLGMNATRSTDPQPIVRNRASGYEWKNDHFENRPVLLPAIAFSAGSLLSSVEDIAKWDAALYTEKLLKKSSLVQIWTAVATNDGAAAPFNYGFGWFIDSYHGHRLAQPERLLPDCVEDRRVIIGDYAGGPNPRTVPIRNRLRDRCGWTRRDVFARLVDALDQLRGREWLCEKRAYKHTGPHAGAQQQDRRQGDRSRPRCAFF